MIDLEKFQPHTTSLTQQAWDMLFSLLPAMEKAQTFGVVKGGEQLPDGSVSVPFWSASDIVDQVCQVLHQLNLLPAFDWTNWEEGRSILENKDFDYASLDTITLCKLLTTIVRADRFHDGFLVAHFENGVIPNIIKALQQNESNKSKPRLDQIKSVLFGVAVGDALGVPVEFKSRESIRQNPVVDMRGYGTYQVPPGTFSDDGSLTFCLAEALTQDFDLHTIGQNFVGWYHHNFWTARGRVFDIGIATREAIDRIAKGVQADRAGGLDVSSNGNGSLMRIAPLLFYLSDKPIHERYQITKQVSAITHGHIRSVIACFYYLEFARQILAQRDKFEIYQHLQAHITSHLQSLSIDPIETALFDRLLKHNIAELAEENIYSSGYVLHTLEASIWCLLTTDNYQDAVLKAVNLGEDTDTTGAVTGGLAGLLYGLDNIPVSWRQQIAKHDDIENLAERLNEKMDRH